METVVMFADISGFTNISEKCAEMGIRGNEELAFCINRYMEGMVSNLSRYGGDIIKFVGDAMIVMWPRRREKGLNQEEEVLNLIRRAIQCGLDIQADMNNKQIMTSVTKMGVKIGIGFGKCAILYVGGVFNRSEFFTVGSALTQALESEGCCTAGGQVVVSREVFNRVQEYFKADPTGPSEDPEGFFQIKGLAKSGATAKNDQFLRQLLQQANMQQMFQKFRSYVPAAIVPYIEISQEVFGSETRRLCVMFASLGVDLSSAKSREGMQKIQKIITTVQQQVYRTEGSLNKLLMDDKGSTLICIWGLFPFCHQDDVSRALLTAFNMRRELKKIDNTWLNVGIATGTVFSGVVGTSGGRKEFSVLGDTVNLAARIMFMPKSQGRKGEINCCEGTVASASNYFNFNFKGHFKFKGKSVCLPVFAPLDPDEASSSVEKLLKIHLNTFSQDASFKTKNPEVPMMLGREKEFQQVLSRLSNWERDQESPYFVSIQGESGMGKSLFAKYLIEELNYKQRTQKGHQFDQASSQASQKETDINILASSLNADSQLKFLNSWQPILRQMLNIMSKRNPDLTKVQILRQYFHHESDKYFIYEDLFGVKGLNDKKIQQLSIPLDPIHFVKRKTYSNEITEAIIDSLLDFIASFLGEEEDEELGQSISSVSSDSEKLTPFVFFFDSVCFMDASSWKIVEVCKNMFSKIAFVFLMENEFGTDQPLIKDDQAKAVFNEILQAQPDFFDVIELPPLETNHLEDLLCAQASDYLKTKSSKVEKMTDIPPLVLKEGLTKAEKDKLENEDKEVQAKAPLEKQRLLDLYSISNKEVFTSVDPEVLETIVDLCDGNPQLCSAFIENCIKKGFLSIQKKRLEASKAVDGRNRFRESKELNDWVEVEVPFIALKANITHLDNFVKTMRSSQDKNDPLRAVKCVLLLKTAAVIGETFSTQNLMCVLPFKTETHKNLMKILQILENFSLIEILDTSKPKNVVCRFGKRFMRESIYQSMLYREQKQELHKLTSHFIQQNQHLVDHTEKSNMRFLSHILRSEDITDPSKMSFPSKQAFLVKRINDRLLSNEKEKTILETYLTKQGKQASKKISKRFVLVTNLKLYWYHNRKEYEQKLNPLGYIYFTGVHLVIPANRQRTTSDFLVMTNKSVKKGKQIDECEEFIFGARDENERDELISVIEYLRVRALADNFEQKYCKINLGINRVMEDQKEEEEDFKRKRNDSVNYRRFAGQYKTIIENKQITQYSLKQPSISPRKKGLKSRKGFPFLQRQTTSVSPFQDTETISNNQSNISQSDLLKNFKTLYNYQFINFTSELFSCNKKQKELKQSKTLNQPDQVGLNNLGRIPFVFRNNKITRISTITEMGNKLDHDKSFSSLGLDDLKQNYTSQVVIKPKERQKSDLTHTLGTGQNLNSIEEESKRHRKETSQDETGFRVQEGQSKRELTFHQSPIMHRKEEEESKLSSSKQQIELREDLRSSDKVPNRFQIQLEQALEVEQEGQEQERAESIDKSQGSGSKLPNNLTQLSIQTHSDVSSPLLRGNKQTDQRRSLIPQSASKIEQLQPNYIKAYREQIKPTSSFKTSTKLRPLEEEKAYKPYTSQLETINERSPYTKPSVNKSFFLNQSNIYSSIGGASKKKRKSPRQVAGQNTTISPYVQTVQEQNLDNSVLTAPLLNDSIGMDDDYVPDVSDSEDQIAEFHKQGTRKSRNKSPYVKLQTQEVKQDFNRKLFNHQTYNLPVRVRKQEQQATEQGSSSQTQQELRIPPKIRSNQSNDLSIHSQSQRKNNQSFELYGRVLQDCFCQLNGQQMQLLEGDRVKVARLIPEHRLIQVKFREQLGLFPYDSIALLDQKQEAIPMYKYLKKNEKKRESEKKEVKKEVPKMAERRKKRLQGQQ